MNFANHSYHGVTFQSEQISLDWISFNFKSSLESNEMQNLFHSFYHEWKFSIFFNSLNQFEQVQTFDVSEPSHGEVYFTPWMNSYWSGVIVNFRGTNARLLYRLLQQSQIYRDFFQDAKLGRIDRCYDRLPSFQDSDLKTFFQTSYQQYQIQTLRQHHWISISRSKRGPFNHKAFLNQEGKQIVADRSDDFNLICMMKEPNSYIFTAEDKPDQMLRRESLTRNVNQIMIRLSHKLSDNPRITSHSFRSGYITKLWKDTQDIEFVRQTIGHAKLDTTSSYIQSLTEQERKRRMFRT